MDIIKLDLEKMTEDEVRAKLMKFGFDFRQHVSLSFDANLKRVVEVEKRLMKQLK
ncbi:hypothetical protein [Vibrio splendidus]|uniref:hypothetical protein n=1 Tax=Vibrio splendidus TaxID=29497 RepID=UPI0012FFD49E|nr:hypothetical protein [Vibrio splendidus]